MVRFGPMSTKKGAGGGSPPDARVSSSKNKSKGQDHKSVDSSTSTYLTLWTLLFILISSKFLFYVIEHLLDELVPPQNGFRLAFLSAVSLLATFLYFSCTEHRIKHIESLRKEKEMLRLLLCGEDCCE